MNRFRSMLSALTLITMLTACGGRAAAPTVPTTAPVAAPTQAPAPTTAAAEPTGAPTDAATGETRLVKHAMGETEVPLNPQRVVTLDMGELDAALALGIKPVGSVTIFEDDKFPAYMGDKTEGIEVVGTIASPNLEKILALKPDLILSSKTRDEERYGLLSQIAPTVFAERLGDAWLDNFRLFAEAMGKQQEGEALITSYEERLSELHGTLSANGPMPTVSMVRFTEGGQTRIYHAGSFIGTILAEGQFSRPAAQQLTDKVWTEASKELIGDLDGDVIFYGIYGKPEDSPLAEYTDDPLWQQLNAVKNGRVFQVNDDYWYTSIGLIAANLVIDDLYKYLVPEAATSSTSADSDAIRTYAHAMGEAEIPVNPERVVVLDAVDNVLALGVKPVGGAQWVGTASGLAPSWPSYIDPAQLEGVTFLGSSAEPNLEQLALLKPDLIIGRINPHEELYDKLAQIAPTVILDIKQSGQWRDEFLQYADILGRTTEAKKLLADYEARAAAIGERLKALNPNPTVSVVRIDPERIVMYQKGLFIGQVLTDAGVARPPSQDVDANSEQLSLETIDQLDADVIFVIESNPAEAKYLSIVDTPLWNQLRAVQNKRIYAVPFDLWIGGWSINGANKVLDALEEHLLAE